MTRSRRVGAYISEPMGADDDFQSRMRKVQSLDFFRFHPDPLSSPTNHIVRNNSKSDMMFDDDDCRMASRFSHDAQRGRYSIGRRSLSARAIDALLGNDDNDASKDQLPADCSSSGVRREVLAAKTLLRVPLTVGFIYVMMVLAMTATNTAFHMVDVHFNSGSLFLDDHHHATAALERPKMGLATAAISTVTETLSPILPFTGGVDLRREEHWDTTQGWFHTASSMLDQIRDAFGQANADPTSVPMMNGPVSNETRANTIGRTLSEKEMQRLKPQPHITALSGQKPFVPLEIIAKMTLSDLSTVFRYAMGKNRVGFNEKAFLKSVEPRMVPIFQYMDKAVSISRGRDVLPARTGHCTTECDRHPIVPSEGTGDVDALQFSAAMRIFGEWRLVRQCPPGYQGFTIGMNLGLKDIVQNLMKIEKAVHDWLNYQRDLLALQGYWDEGMCSGIVNDDDNDCVLRSPTLRELLLHEIRMKTHRQLPRLKDRTGAMGLLWVRRQLQYHTALSSNVLKIPTVFPTTTDALYASYNMVYGQYHGWAVQKIFTYSFQAAPPGEEIYKYMNPYHMKDTLERASSMNPSTVNEEDATVASSDLEDPIEESNDNPLQQFGKHIAGEWEKLAQAVGGLIDKKNKEEKMVVTSNGSGLTGQELEDFVTEEMTQNAFLHLEDYLDTVGGLLEDLASLFEELNMDDPTRV